MANRILAKYVSAAFILFENTKKTLAAKKFFLFGYPLRSSIAILSKRKKLSVANDKKLNLLIFGGSQGSKIINSSVQSMLEKYPEILGQFNIIHQVGDHDFIRSSNFYKSKNWDLNFIKFINDMDVKYLWADIAICRAGIGTVSEVSALGIPSLFIPLASAADNHQQKNAEVLVSAGAADILLESELNADTLAAKLKSFASSPEYLKLMSEKMKSFYNPGAAEKIACEMLQLNK
jgi:UDP-N-acetylglucosamine--N-acetylmuramyl-(pentapeptide) pyrophosphoryl-undecaprenol N-acetylglucosamine transferase